MVRLEGLEPPTYALEGRCSIQLSYRRKTVAKWGFPFALYSQGIVEQEKGIEPS